jgi:hypothetical protein
LLVECVEPLLPTTVALNTDLDASEDHLLTTAKVDSQLDDVTILYPKRFGFHIWLAQPDVVEKSPR